MASHDSKFFLDFFSEFFPIFREVTYHTVFTVPLWYCLGHREGASDEMVRGYCLVSVHDRARNFAQEVDFLLNQ
jgi:hypothetical protein